MISKEMKTEFIYSRIKKKGLLILSFFKIFINEILVLYSKSIQAEWIFSILRIEKKRKTHENMNL